MSMEVFGKALMDYYYGKKEPLRIIRDDGHEDEDCMDLYFAEYKDWPAIEKDIITQARGKVLDIGCGAGRHTVYLQGRGLDCMAIDMSNTVLRLAKMRGVKKTRLANASKLPFTRPTFDTVLLFCNNFGVCGNKKATKKMLEDLRKITTTDGTILTTCRDPLKTDKEVHLKYHRKNLDKGRPAGQVRIRFEYKGEEGKWFELWMATPEEMKEVVRECGWYVSRTVDGKHGMYAAVIKKG